jgi:transcription elongation GreA/GreB family factor
MNKASLIASIIEMLERDLLRLKEAARATYDAATHEESKPENEYDTFALEASYLAGAQAKRVAEIEEVLFLFGTLKNQLTSQSTFAKTIASGSLVEIEGQGRKSWVLVMPKGGGISLSFEGQSVQVVTPHSPFGEALLGLEEGDAAVVETGSQVRQLDVLTVC